MVSITKIPRWGIHRGIKYSPRRSIVKICPVCSNLFLHWNKGNKKYCTNICSSNAKRSIQRIIDNKLIKRRDKFEHANKRRDNYAQCLTNEKTWTIGTDYAPKYTVNEEGNIDWANYHEKLQKKKERMGIS